MSLSPRTLLGPYEIVAPLGAGGMGEVYQARDTRLNRTVAIKVLKGPHSDRFEREARAISALNHPHICALHDIGSQGATSYLVLEYVEGKPLEGPLPVETALRYAIEIADALDAAVLHTFSIKFFQHLALRFPEVSVQENLFHLVGEVEIVFGLWTGVLVACIGILQGAQPAIQFLERANFTEPVFVFAIMAVATTRPVIQFATALIGRLASLLPATREISFYVVALTLGPLLGSFITEPATMTVTALILRDRFFAQGLSNKLKYVTLSVLFVNVSWGRFDSLRRATGFNGGCHLELGFPPYAIPIWLESVRRRPTQHGIGGPAFLDAARRLEKKFAEVREHPFQTKNGRARWIERITAAV